jgi:hypothetical protein
VDNVPDGVLVGLDQLRDRWAGLPPGEASSEHHAEAVALTEALDHHHGTTEDTSERNGEKSETNDQPGEPEGEPS